MGIDAVLVAYGSEDVIAGALTLVGALGGRAVVVDHGDGASARIAASMGAVAIHDPSNPGFGTGQNRGLSFARTEYVLLCNPDAELVPDAVLAGAELLRTCPRVAAVQGVIMNRGTGQPERSAGVELTAIHLLGRALGVKRLLKAPAVAAIVRRSRTLQDHADRVPSGPTEVESLAATAMLIRRSAFESVRGFDEAYFLYGEDLDLCHRLRAAGWALVTVPEVWATHVSGGSAASGWSREANWWRGTMQFAARRWGSGAWFAAVTAASVRWARLAVGHPSQARPAFRSMVAEPLRCRSQRGGNDRTASMTGWTCSSSM